MAELTAEQKEHLAAIDAKVEARIELSAEDVAFLEENAEALESISADEVESE